MYLVYTGMLSTQSNTELVDKEDREYADLVNLYVFAEKVGDEQAKDTVFHAIKTKMDDHQGHIRIEVIGAAFDGTPDGNPLRTLLVDHHAGALDVCWLEELDGYEPHPEFLLQLSRALLIEKRRRLRLDANVTIIDLTQQGASSNLEPS